MGALDTLDVQKIVVDIAPDVLALGNVELHQEIIVAADGIKLGMNLAQRDVIGDSIGRAGGATDLNEKADHCDVLYSGDFGYLVVFGILPETLCHDGL